VEHHPATNSVFSPSSEARHRLDAVDALRGLAIFFVLMNHVNMRLFLDKFAYWQAMPDALRSALVWNGQNGVQIFFVISGFLITSTSLRRWGTLSAIRVRDFYRLRFARIAPLLLLLLCVLCILHFAGTPGFVVSQETGGLGRALFAALAFHINLLEAQRGYLPGSWDILWSLSVEEMFYLFFPLICRWAGREKLLLIILAVFVALGPIARTLLTHGNETWKEVSYLGGMDAIALGCLTALVLAKLRSAPRVAPRVAPRASLPLALAGICALVFILGFTADDDVLARLGLDMTVLAVGTCLIIAATAQSARKGAERSMRKDIAMLEPLRWLGRRSYEVYLTHMFVVMGFFYVFVPGGRPGAAVTPLFIAVIAFSAILGEMVARYFSDPLNRMLRHHWE
jgi:peptidoglycan/LPS O-acetylase OafA/YrhL